MSRIPEQVIEAVLKHHDIVDVVGQYVHLSKQGRYLKGLCPFHSEKTPSFTVTPEKQIYHCFGCGAGGNAIKFVMELEGYSFSDAVKHMAKSAGLAADWADSPEEDTEEQKDRERLLKSHDLVSKFYHYILKNTKEGKQAVDYLRNRGFTDGLIDEFQLGYAPASWDTLVRFLQQREFPLELMDEGGLLSRKSDGSGHVDRFRNRIMFPIRDGQGRVIAFAARALGDEQPKYLNSPETLLFHKGRSFFNLHLARPAIRRLQQSVLFEGYADVIQSWASGVHNGVASMGTALTDDQCLALRRLAPEAVLCYDGDSAGQSAAYKNIAPLEKAGCTVKVALMPEGKDPDDYIRAHGAEKFRHLIQSAVPAVKFKLIHLRRHARMNEEDGRIQFSKSALRIIAGLPSPTEREHYLKDLQSETDFSLEALKQELFQLMQEMQKNRDNRDNNHIPWNNVMNERREAPATPALLPAYHKAERNLLHLMMQDRDTALYVEGKLGDRFNVEAHAALAAYLYAYYAKHSDADPSGYIGMLQHDGLERLATSIAFSEQYGETSMQVIDDYIKEILKYPQMMNIKQKKEEMVRAERTGDVAQAVRIASEIIALEQQLKSI